MLSPGLLPPILLSSLSLSLLAHFQLLYPRGKKMDLGFAIPVVVVVVSVSAAASVVVDTLPSPASHLSGCKTVPGYVRAVCVLLSFSLFLVLLFPSLSAFPILPYLFLLSVIPMYSGSGLCRYLSRQISSNPFLDTLCPHLSPRGARFGLDTTDNFAAAALCVCAVQGPLPFGPVAMHACFRMDEREREL